jgi:methionyl-tRNA formyltransferase
MEEFLRVFGEVVRIRTNNWDTVRSLKPRFIFVPHWHWKIPNDIHERFETVMFHATDLPYGRGGSPVRNLIRLGAKSTMLTAFRCVEELDAGPVYMKVSVPVLESEDATLDLMVPMMNVMAWTIIDSCLQPTPQIGNPTYFERSI